MKLKLNILFLLLSISVFAQDTTRTKKNSFFDKSKLFAGGTIGLQFGTVTFVDVSPLIGYRITDKLSAGVGITYQYYSYRDKTYHFETNVFGGRIFGRYFFTQNLFAHGEYEVLNLEAYDLNPPTRINVGSLFAGGGFIQRFGRNSGITAMILYNFTPSQYTPYTNPVIRIGMVVGF